MTTLINMERVILAAPFGNHLSFLGVTSTIGSYTLFERKGRAWRMLKTLRKIAKAGGWVNKIGLRNPGIMKLKGDVLAEKTDLRGKIFSLAGDVDGENQWNRLLHEATVWPRNMEPLCIEINLSCPNVDKPDDDLLLKMDNIYSFFKKSYHPENVIPISVKIPPVRYDAIVHKAYELGVRHFTCSNTLPVPGGGLSGVPQRLANEQTIQLIRKAYPDVEIWACGGIQTVDDAKRYLDMGANRIVLGSVILDWYMEIFRTPRTWFSSDVRMDALESRIHPFRVLVDEYAAPTRDYPRIKNLLLDRIASRGESIEPSPSGVPGGSGDTPPGDSQ